MSILRGRGREAGAAERFETYPTMDGASYYCTLLIRLYIASIYATVNCGRVSVCGDQALVDALNAAARARLAEVVVIFVATHGAAL